MDKYEELLIAIEEDKDRLFDYCGDGQDCITIRDLLGVFNKLKIKEALNGRDTINNSSVMASTSTTTLQ